MSLTGSLASAATSNAMTGVSRGVSQAIGKPTGGVTTPGSRDSLSHGEINWVNFNYPPLLRVIHYDIEELPSSLTGLVRRMNMSFNLTVLSCVLNLFDILVIVVSVEKAPKRWFIQSGLHLLMLPAAALAVFYSGYRGLAEPDQQLLTRYKVAQPILGAAFFIMALVPFGCINGLSKLATISNFTDGSVFWTVVILIESFLWAVNALLAAGNLYGAKNFDQFGACGSAAAGSRL
mmetsp:Transcript_70819/g.196745  ORF Transcript_70819/g.196745 Transcript_70819/m.196745 type:complete len:234 (+) Transcript_70819:50-751(+)|eukprot:CAMPEP_0117537324 /NCGR_PEP_ID=MMETSP0784-20121206/41904_1 /TAXON_ID=39447 /ORGANISM="" /LENGTH=233 /DNA_ID=CAMNT_0005333903 /DNA_START=45 /DNA_END=746 /DNA_ORIENTATION=+